MTTTPNAVLPPERRDPGSAASGSGHRPVALLAVSGLVAAVLVLPLVFLLIEASGAGVSRLAA